MIRMSMNRFVAMVFVGVGLVGCGSKTISECSADSDCKNLVYPFCDVNGEFSTSGGVKNVCTIIPPDCSVERCGCSPGATTCAGDQETTCNSDGKSTTTDTCALGCASTKDRCLSFTPLNGLGPALNAATTEPAIVITAGSTIDTDSGIILNSANAKINASTLVVTGPTDIRVFLGGSFDIDDVVITGTKAVAFVSPGAVTIRGMIDASANKNVSGPGGSGTGCVGETSTDPGVDILGGGGGHATIGGAGGSIQIFTQSGDPYVLTVAGGPARMGSALVGGCIGGGGTSAAGGGGGAIQFDSLSKIEFTATPKLGFIDVGGGGARDASGRHSGGGAGGQVVLEAPEIALGGVTTNGGSGATCGVDGNDATRDRAVAAGVGSTCGGHPTSYSGGGGTIDQAPTKGNGQYGGGGGGAVGAMFVNTVDGTYSTVIGSIVSAYGTMGSLMPI